MAARLPGPPAEVVLVHIIGHLVQVEGAHHTSAGSYLLKAVVHSYCNEHTVIMYSARLLPLNKSVRIGHLQITSDPRVELERAKLPICCLSTHIPL